ncbi:hypothetical protein LIPSTDRAFT_254348 [Lipomyces starkeyi NRRL Y-11557]|uniref:Uncharacterized protein n=1 Tax=Lipomyces starkeyi NRRL Y-11557 TaxID=675824 RepID=A0A1E3QBP6_LIPST|nr:hypothetical protein LIPSTDRAFT_254348 [Lipomyces starkeyi NRRL Y-11557]
MRKNRRANPAHHQSPTMKTASAGYFLRSFPRFHLQAQQAGQILAITSFTRDVYIIYMVELVLCVHYAVSSLDNPYSLLPSSVSASVSYNKHFWVRVDILDNLHVTIGVFKKKINFADY